MDDQSDKAETKHPICPHCQKPYQGRCHCRQDSSEAARTQSPDPVVDRPVTPDGRPDPGPPPPSDRSDQLPDPDLAPPRQPEPELIEPDSETDSNQPDPGQKTPSEPEEVSAPTAGPDSEPSPEAAAEEQPDSRLDEPAAAEPAILPAGAGRSSPARQGRWGWLLVFGPLAVALGIILWFQFRVLSPPGGEVDPTVDFPPVDRQPIAQLPAAADPPPVADPPPADAPVVDTPAESDPESEPTEPETSPEEEPDPDEEIEPEEIPEPEPIDPTLFRQFGRQAFINLFDSTGHLPNLASYAGQPSITGDAASDEKLRVLASQAGYLIQPVPADSSQLVGVHQLQPLVADAWAELSRAAAAAGQPLTITLGYLSPADQARLLADALGGETADESLRAAFRQVMVPGYSRHQTGFVIDIVAANQPGIRFQETGAYAWLAADNFAALKHFGFVPSQPDSSPHGRSQHLVAFELAFVGRDRLLISP